VGHTASLCFVFFFKGGRFNSIYLIKHPPKSIQINSIIPSFSSCLLLAVVYLGSLKGAGWPSCQLSTVHCPRSIVHCENSLYQKPGATPFLFEIHSNVKDLGDLFQISGTSPLWAQDLGLDLPKDSIILGTIESCAHHPLHQRRKLITHAS
jgi:hypothetical protein